MTIIALTTDFGTRDHYVSAMKGVILSIAPSSTIVDVTHEVAPFDVTHAAFVLRHSLPWFPAGSIHLAVVDPGVGSSRRILLAKYDRRYVIAPDNGLLTFLHRDLTTEGLYAIENRKYFLGSISNTFHGRDIMAPVAAHLALGTPEHVFGRRTDTLEVLSLPPGPTLLEDAIAGQVIYADRFGNLVTNVSASDLTAMHRRGRAPFVWMDEKPVGFVAGTFSDVAVSAMVAYVGSSDLLELGVRGGRACDRFPRYREVKVVIRPADKRGRLLEGGESPSS